MSPLFAQLRPVLGQINPLVGDIEGNAELVMQAINEARERDAGLLVFPELVLTGYPPEDLLMRQTLLDRVESALAEVMAQTQGITVVLGLPWVEEGRLYNAAVVLSDGRLLGRYFKQRLPNYSVFDEKRYFQSGTEALVVECRGVKLGITICEDVWQREPVQQVKAAGAQVIVSINASPYRVQKQDERLAVLCERIAEAGLPIIYTNLIGGQDELLFDGGSLMMDEEGDVVAQAPRFETALWAHDDGVANVSWGDTEEIYKALVLGVRDYVHKNGFRGALIGLSGGIDSAVTLAIAVDALGADAVQAVMMPSRYTADMSLTDAETQARMMGVEYDVIAIEPAFHAFLDMLAPNFKGMAIDVTEENLQARSRGVVLMALSNKTGRMLLTTGNKSEMAVGYATLYGDMAGGFAPLKNVYKTEVYRLANYRNTISPVIPERVITREPSAELAPDQKDQDSLPPYEVLDGILSGFIEDDLSVEALLEQGFDDALVRRVIHMVLNNEYKRRQAAPGVRITRRAFGKDRRYPITSGYGRRLS